jgi:putative glutamine amidotransferase
MQSPRIAITVGSEWPRKSYANYLERIAEAGGEPVVASPGCDVQALLETADGLLVPGGVDVAPARYGAEPAPELDTVDPARDETEFALLRSALDRDLPVFAICRGHQVLNVAFGGRLQQHIPGDGHRAHAEPPHESRYHDVAVEEGSVLADLLGAGVRRVNSRHHQAVRQGMVGEGLLPSAMSPDGIVEGLESPAHRWVLGVQWHPERPEVADDFQPLFSAFVLAARDARVPAS